MAVPIKILVFSTFILAVYSQSLRQAETQPQSNYQYRDESPISTLRFLDPRNLLELAARLTYPVTSGVNSVVGGILGTNNRQPPRYNNPPAPTYSPRSGPSDTASDDKILGTLLRLLIQQNGTPNSPTKPAETLQDSYDSRPYESDEQREYEPRSERDGRSYESGEDEPRNGAVIPEATLDKNSNGPESGSNKFTARQSLEAKDPFNVKIDSTTSELPRLELSGNNADSVKPPEQSLWDIPGLWEIFNEYNIKPETTNTPTPNYSYAVKGGTFNLQNRHHHHSNHPGYVAYSYDSTNKPNQFYSFYSNNNPGMHADQSKPTGTVYTSISSSGYSYSNASPNNPNASGSLVQGNLGNESSGNNPVSFQSGNGLPGADTAVYVFQSNGPSEMNSPVSYITSYSPQVNVPFNVLPANRPPGGNIPVYFSPPNGPSGVNAPVSFLPPNIPLGTSVYSSPANGPSGVNAPVSFLPPNIPLGTPVYSAPPNGPSGVNTPVSFLPPNIPLGTPVYSSPPNVPSGINPASFLPPSAPSGVYGAVNFLPSNESPGINAPFNIFPAEGPSEDKVPFLPTNAPFGGYEPVRFVPVNGPLGDNGPVIYGEGPSRGRVPEAKLASNESRFEGSSPISYVPINGPSETPIGFVPADVPLGVIPPRDTGLATAA